MGSINLRIDDELKARSYAALEKEMAALVQKQIESLWAQLEQLLRQQAEKKNEDATVQPDKKEEKKDDTNTAGTIDIYV